MAEDNDYQPEVHKAILAETSENNHESAISDEKVTTLFRPDDRTSPSNNRYIAAISGYSFVGLIAQKGSHETKQLARFKWLKLVQIIERFAAAIKDLDSQYFKNAYSHIKGEESLIQYLQQKYPKQTINRNSIITVYTIEYK